MLFVSPDRARQGIGGALIEALCVQYPAQILTVDASITAKPCFTAHGFKVVAEQRVAARGEWFINYRMEKTRGAKVMRGKTGGGPPPVVGLI
ncbi:Uncharacterized acetyltransferase YafP [Klebsiella pneumoniae IS46]|nr:Uncharacterized acetyltransferase YafP [Klebsiella pneumoniae IS46]